MDNSPLTISRSHHLAFSPPVFMPNPFFRFKQFTVWHDRCAMKVGTDGVLLGAWAMMEGAKTLLDIGTGSGLIALMLAQRYPALNIEAIEIDEQAARQANENFSKSPWGGRLTALHCPLCDFTGQGAQTFDAIVSNPPFFLQSLPSPDRQRTTARHASLLTPESLLHDSSQLLSANGSLHLILPVAEGETLIETAMDYQLYCHRATYVYPKPQSAPKRLLMTLKKTTDALQQDTLTIETGTRHQYTEEYIHLTHEFYLNM